MHGPRVSTNCWSRSHHTTIHADTVHITDCARAYFTPYWPEAPATATGPQITALHDGPPLDHDRPHTHYVVMPVR
ncbi:hypothetical protein [Streptomyces jumonjinensis]|uniref:hypothetical protein n=1 Tax=Streptomyces jumonjinensis TaxID=1945 RepID=UPI00379FA228